MAGRSKPKTEQHTPDADALDRVITDQPLQARDLRAAMREMDRRLTALETSGGGSQA